MTEKKYLDRNCPYCNLISGKLNNIHVLYKDTIVTAFMNHMPVNPGHAIVIPNVHYSNPSSLPENIAGKMYFIATRIGVACKRAMDSTGYNIISSDGFCAGQDIQHAHLHIIPRYLNDNWHLNWRALPSDFDITNTYKIILAKLLI
ncbi:MAG TPA: hypothetical protein DD381_02300 [Lentisphaeria bacterium]|nr:MAG: hypothetical protein A2X47_08735 [Lentisphaerae bacterium GWF2_38_69]HBM15168.1 hypothetical protein [Lentisphaeria bacterium]